MQMRDQQCAGGMTRRKRTLTCPCSPKALPSSIELLPSAIAFGGGAINAAFGPAAPTALPPSIMIGETRGGCCCCWGGATLVAAILPFAFRCSFNRIKASRFSSNASCASSRVVVVVNPFGDEGGGECAGTGEAKEDDEEEDEIDV